MCDVISDLTHLPQRTCNVIVKPLILVELVDGARKADCRTIRDFYPERRLRRAAFGPDDRLDVIR
jgi:hypothetical protein